MWETTKKVIKITNPLTGMIIDAVEGSIGKSSRITEKGDIDEMKLEAMRQEISARISEVQAKVAQEIAIANRIDEAEEVTIEEYYDISGEGGIGLKASEGNATFGINGGGRKITKRIYTFKGFRNDEMEIIESIND